MGLAATWRSMRAYLARYVPSAYRGLARDTAIYATGSFLVRSVSFLIVPILTRALSQDRFGVLDVLTTIQGLAAISFGLNLDSALARYYYQYDAAEDRQRLVSTLLWTVATAGAFATLLLALLSGEISQWLFHVADYRIAVILVGATIPVMALGNLGLSVFRYDRRPIDYIAITFCGTAAQLGLVFVAVYTFEADVTAIVAVQMSVHLIVTVLALGRNHVYLAPVFVGRLLRRCLQFSLPMMPSVLISWVLNSANRFFLLSFASLSAVATYAVASKVSMVLLAAVQAFAMAWVPFAMSIMHRDDARRIYAKVMYVVVTTLSGAVIVAAFSGRALLGYYAGPAYAAAGTLAALLMLSTCIGQGFGLFVGLGLLIRERTGYTSVAQVATLLASTLLNLLLIPLWHENGAGLALLGASIVQALALSYASNRFYPFRYSRWVWAGPAVAGAAIAVVAIRANLMVN